MSYYYDDTDWGLVAIVVGVIIAIVVVVGLLVWAVSNAETVAKNEKKQVMAQNARVRESMRRARVAEQKQPPQPKAPKTPVVFDMAKPVDTRIGDLAVGQKFRFPHVEGVFTVSRKSDTQVSAKSDKQVWDYQFPPEIPVIPAER